MNSPTLLLILDGWGCAPAGPGNAVTLARTPNLERLFAAWPHTSLACSGRDVGLPDGFMGNSEVGHMNIGAGRVVYQDMTRIDLAIETGEFAGNPVLADTMARAKAAGGRVHLLGLVSDGGVHSHLNHIAALLELARAQGVEALVHAFLDGRDTPPKSGAGYMRRLAGVMERIGAGRVASVMGRFYAMDRDKRWERNAVAWSALVDGQGEPAGSDPAEAVEAAYASGQTDEFVTPRLPAGPNGRPVPPIADGDAVIFFNFRADRARQLVRAFIDPAFDGFSRARLPRLAALACMTRYDAAFGLPVAFPPQELNDCLGEVVSRAGLRQLRIAETEKYAHVTYFFNCGREEPFPGEERLLVPSPRDVPTYDLKPEMSAREVTAELLARLPSVDLAVCNLANLDMVGHTGVLPAAVTAAEVVDECVGRIADALLSMGGRMLLTADHGNSEEMLDPAGQVQTAHSVNPVPLLFAGPDAGRAALRSGGRLADIAPTLLDLLGQPRPAAMTGRSLIAGGQAWR